MLPGFQQRWSRFRSSPARRTPRLLLPITTVMGMFAAIVAPVTAFDPTAVTDDAAAPSVSIGIIIDRSGSMDFGEGSRTPKIALARTAVKHIVLMTDGEYQGRSDYQPLIDQMRALGITFSTVAIGKDADQTLLQRLASAGGGQYHSVIRADDLPEIVRMDVQTSTIGTN